MLVKPDGAVHEVDMQLECECTNNRAEYEALAYGLEVMVDMGIKNMEAFGDSNLVVQQIRGDSQCLDGTLNECRERCMDLIQKLDPFYIQHVHRAQNRASNELAHHTSGYRIMRGRFAMKQKPTRCTTEDVNAEEPESAPEDQIVPGDWRYIIRECIRDPSSIKDRKVQHQVLKYTVIGDELYRRFIDRLLLRCLGEEQAKISMGEVHEGMCGLTRQHTR
jgi:ribonuclease HI